MRHKRGHPPMTGRPPFKPAALFTIHRFYPSPTATPHQPFLPCRPPFFPPPTNLREFTPVAGQHPRKCRLERLLSDDRPCFVRTLIFRRNKIPTRIVSSLYTFLTASSRPTIPYLFLIYRRPGPYHSLRLARPIFH